MARISGVDLPREKRVEIGLTYIYGIGLSSAKRILAEANVDPDTRVRDLTDDEVKRISAVINDTQVVEGDLRRDVSIGQVADGRIYCKKFVVAPVLPNQSDANFIVLRYADVLLMYAEALNEKGYKADGNALNYLNDIHERAGLKAYTTDELSSQELFREAVWKERRFELAFENHRWFDLLRTGKAVEIMNSSVNGEFIVETYQLLFPIPQSQIDASPNKMTQNDKY